MLYIYRASAGSGKTFLLTGFYIELLFRNELTPSLEGKNLLFSEILAVTFTNKATAEMKERIVKDLNILWCKPTESAYYAKLKTPDASGRVMTDEEIQHRAQEILRGMLTDYSNLHISTIDSFFQQVIRSFAHELNLQGNYQIELDADMVLDHAVSQFLLTLDPKNDPETFQWIVRFTNSRIANGDKWNIHQELFKLSKVLLTEDYRRHSQLINDFTSNKQEMSDYVDLLEKTVKELRIDLKRIGKECCEILERHGLTADEFSYGKASAAQSFAKWREGEPTLGARMTECAQNQKKWFSAANARLLDKLGEEAETLQQHMQEAVELLSGERMRDFTSANMIRRNIFQLGLLSSLERAANEYCAEQGIKLLSDTTQLLNHLVAEQSAPFIYEKTGNRIRCYMIDEFQDTSGMQWANFSPLLSESLGTNNRNLIVGDVKQSIYRWRGSDWELLHERINDFEPWKHAFSPGAQGEEDGKLKDNWRSHRKIIRFNNEFFRFASQRFHQLEPENEALRKIEEIYDDVEQTISPFRKMKDLQGNRIEVPDGEVSVESLESDNNNKQGYETALSRRLPELVIALEQKGFRPKDILILCRTRAQCHFCAQTLLAYQHEHPESPYGMNIITQEALLLGKQLVVRTLVSVLEYLHDPSSDFCRAMAGICWMSLSHPSINEAVADFFSQPDHPDFLALMNLPLYETVERLIAQLPAKVRLETAFLNAFRDVVLNYCTREGGDLDGFLAWWNENGYKCSVTTPSNQDAIRIMTIHQSKGLDGEAVIVPFALDMLDLECSGVKQNLLWCTPKEGRLARPNLVLPIDLSTKMKESIFVEDFNQERIRAIIDNLNTAYVAFTRARRALIILTPAPPKKENNTLHSFLNKFYNEKWEAPKDTFKVDENFDTSLLSMEDIQEVNRNDSPVVGQTAPLPQIKQTEYVPADDSPATRGTTLHAAFSALKDNRNVEKDVARIFHSGRAQLLGFTLDEVIDYVTRALGDERVQEWFDPANRTLNEQDIVTRTTHTQRPDRMVFTPDGRTIIIDYKTGEEHASRYHRQVSYYMKLMRDMGFERVEGYLWYIETGKIVAVK